MRGSLRRINDEDIREADAECPSGKAYAYPGGLVSEMLPAVVVFTGSCRVSGYQSYRTQDKKARRAGCI